MLLGTCQNKFGGTYYEVPGFTANGSPVYRNIYDKFLFRYKDMKIWRMNELGPNSEVVNVYINSVTEHVIDGTEVGVWCDGKWAAVDNVLQKSTIGHTCVTCEEGKYKSTFDKSACVECAEGTYYNKLDPSHCLACSENGHSPRGSVYDTDCKCGKGFTGLHTMCTICESGKYKARIGDSSCEMCPDNSVTTGIASARSDCACKDGFHLGWVIENGPVYDFTPSDSIGSFLSYAQSIGAEVNNLHGQYSTSTEGGVYGDGDGWIDFRLPLEFEQVQVRFRNMNNRGRVELYLGGVKMYTANPTSTVNTRVMDYASGDTLRILDIGNSVIQYNLVITMSKNQSTCEPCAAAKFRTMETDPIRCASCPLHASLCINV